MCRRGEREAMKRGEMERGGEEEGERERVMGRKEGNGSEDLLARVH